MISERLPILAVFFVISWVAFLIAYKAGFFSRKSTWVRKGSLIATFGAFVIYFFYSLIAEPILLGIISLIEKQFQHLSVQDLRLMTAAGVNIFFMLLIAMSLLAYSFAWEKVGIRPIGKGSGKDLLIGVVSWGLAFPVVLFIGHLSVILVQIFYQQDYSQFDQVAVKYVKTLLDYPLMFSLNSIGIVLLVPISEEILFRGFFQSWLVQYTKRSLAIAISALLFALMHYSPEQEIANFELLFALFFLGLLLGFLYERQKTLLAPIGLHCFFNLVSLVIIIFR